MKTDSTATRISKTRTSDVEVPGFSPGRAARAKAHALHPIVFLIALAVWFAACVQPRPILILVSMDGWRWDYLDRAPTPHLNALAAAGVRSEGLIPSFPSKTFPNHYTIVTGLYPAHHGIVSNNMLDATIGEQRFSMSAATAKDPRWWGGQPLWVTAQKQGLRAAAMFWPGSEVEIGGIRPSFWKPFDDDLPNRDRTQQVLDWLRLPEAERPSFLTLYFSEVDHAGHDFGPESAEVLEAAAHLDAEIGFLVDGVNAIGLASRVHYVIVSDHGMSQNSTERVVVLDDFIDMTTVTMIDSSPVVGLWPKSGTAEDIYRALKDKHPHLAVYRRAEVPAHLHYNENPRISPVIGIASDGWAVGSKVQSDDWQSGKRRLGGNHGYDPSTRSMHGLFIASGPRFRKGATIPPLENIHLYSMMARVLGLEAAPNDGNPGATAAVFR
jgi:predicted AlkP superfamily pyrophosphatase or phosphodiesterase